MKPKNEYTIKARNQKKKLLLSETVTGFLHMKEARGAIHRTLKHVWYRLTVDEKDGAPGAAGQAVKKLELTVKRNSTASAQRGYDVFSLYNGKKQYNDSTYRSRSAAKQAASAEMLAHNGRFGKLQQESF